MKSENLKLYQPLNSYLDFQLLYKQWDRLSDKKEPSTCLYHDLLRRIKDFPDLNKSPMDPEDLKKSNNKLGLGLILGSLFPLSGQEEKRIFGISKPFEFTPIYATKAFKDQFLDEKGAILIPENLDTERLYFQKMLLVYGLILDQFFGIKINPVNPLVFKMSDEEGISRHYQIQFNDQFVKVVAKGSLPDIHDRSEVCSGNSPSGYDLNQWMELLPLELFEFHGFFIEEAIEITTAQAVAQLNETVLKQDQVSVEDFLYIVEDSVKSLLGRSNLKVGLAILQRINKRMVLTESRLAFSYLIRNLCKGGCEDSLKAVLDFLSKIDTPVFLNDLSENPEDFPFGEKIIQMGIREIILYPLKHNGNLVGVLEVCGKEEQNFDPSMLMTLDFLAPSLSLALHRQAENLDHRIKGIIRKNFTAIHPVVEWKFDEIALDYVLAEEEGKTPEIKPIVFKDVYPLYAAVDIKNSSRERNRAIHDDFIIQLTLAKNIVLNAKERHYLPILESVIDKIEEFENRINLILLSEEEVRISEFFQNEVEPLFYHLATNFEDMKPAVEEYFSNLDPQSELVNQNRKAFESTMQLINQTVASYLEQEELKIQRMFPHYFEKFKTDGIEYNIYIGQSLVKGSKFDEIYLKNLRLWQLQTLVEVVGLVAEKSPEFLHPLETTQLILVHHLPISISFRLDERKFDVEGSTNVRYEIIKKRIDKALVAGTNERLTQPGKIAIVYTQSKEAEEFRDFIHFLQKKGKLREEIEELELEEMQGVHGLKALRVTVNLTESERKVPVSKLISQG
ncbi:GAF domain-containing protein [Algoriphagus sp. CAU 1675]|uniref:GAF domain-containing protein n=1 Tax=Algoriphagus sp. CAU 1675 TaxID=3032597 RepID=UPI0023DAAEBC|nr:GAF domain-containing protein [Algoriphagus sp. CAU 1675]MDF2158562.1 GAF domain-containing protein [Algoriphagus sp. CAU 1675]